MFFLRTVSYVSRGCSILKLVIWNEPFISSKLVPSHQRTSKQFHSIILFQLQYCLSVSYIATQPDSSIQDGCRHDVVFKFTSYQHEGSLISSGWLQLDLNKPRRFQIRCPQYLWYRRIIQYSFDKWINLTHVQMICFLKHGDVNHSYIEWPEGTPIYPQT